MKITLNNKETEINDYNEINVKELLAVMKFTFPMIVVKVNGLLVKKAEYLNYVVKDGDRVEAIHLIGGG